MKTPAIVCLLLISALSLTATTNTGFVEDAGFEIVADQINFGSGRIQNEDSIESGELRFEIWLTTSIYQGGILTGWRIAQQSLGTLDAGYGFPELDFSMITQLPNYGSYYSMAVLTEWNGTQFEIIDWLNFTEIFKTYPVEIMGTASFHQISAYEIEISLDEIASYRSNEYLSGPLTIELWAFSVDNPSNAHLVASIPFDGLWGGLSYINISETVAFSRPPDGQYTIEIFLREEHSTGVFTSDAIQFDDVWTFETPEAQVTLELNTSSTPILSWEGIWGYNYQLQYSSDLTNWTALDDQPLVDTDSILNFEDTTFTSASNRFYRVVVSPL